MEKTLILMVNLYDIAVIENNPSAILMVNLYNIAVMENNPYINGQFI